MSKNVSKSQKSAATTKAKKIAGLLRRNNGATIAELVNATGWQAHSVRGFISGALGKKMGIKVESFKSESGERAYRVAQ